MKVLVSFVFCLATLYSQTAPPPSTPNTLPNLPDNTPYAKYADGTVLTIGDVRGLLAAVNNPQAANDVQGFLNQYGVMRKLAKLAVSDKLDQEQPTKEQLEFARVLTLFQAELTHRSNPIVQLDDEKAYYEQHKADYKQVKTYAIYVAFSNAGSGSVDAKVLTEEQAKAKAEKLLDQIHKGADFKKLAKENSDDDASRAKDGFFADLKSSATGVPDSIRNAIFALKEGETTGVVKQPNGFYIFRAESMTYQPYEEVRDEVDRSLKQARFREWFEGQQEGTKAALLDTKNSGK
ncbi:MAG TPA: peptidylprolyl isomerase [Bryobacteraceae bacterium]|jgi:parvulin-like peptidyl-prolyl isomerase|nr:peptidylprolyl isomerase [Bryobacteraceae bacterium]